MVSTQVAMNVMTTCVLDISTIFFITQHSRVQKYKSFPIRQILRKKNTYSINSPPTLAFSITASDSANFSCIVAIFLVLLFLLVYFVLALLVFAASKYNFISYITSFALAFAVIDIESCLSEHLSTSHPVSIILNPKLLLMQYFQKKQF